MKMTYRFFKNCSKRALNLEWSGDERLSRAAGDVPKESRWCSFSLNYLWPMTEEAECEIASVAYVPRLD